MIRIELKKPSQVIPVIILFAIFVILFIQMLSRAGNNDFTSYILSSKALLEKTNPYDTESVFPYVYPLTLAFLLIPFAYMPVIFLQVAWFMLNVFFLYKIFVWTFDQLSIKTDNGKYIFILFFVIISLNIFQNNLLNGQINVTVLFLCLLFFVNYKKCNAVSASIFLSVAISIKLVPVFLLLFLFMRKKYKMIMVVMILTVIFILLPFVITGEKIITYYEFYFQNFLSSNLSSVYNDEYQSGMFFSFIGLIKYINPILATGLLPTALCTFLVIAIYFFLEKFYIKKNNSLIYFLYLPGFLLISPVSETHHLIYLSPVIFLLLSDYWRNYSQKNYFDYFLIFIVLIFNFLGKKFNYLYFPLIIISCVLFLKDIVKEYSKSNQSVKI